MTIKGEVIYNCRMVIFSCFLKKNENQGMRFVIY